MITFTPSNLANPALTSYYWHDDAIRSRSVSAFVLSSKLDIPAPGLRVTADWERDMFLQMNAGIGFEVGDVEALPLARARTRWPTYGQCVQAASDWTRTIGLHDLLATSDVALMACHGAKYHHDGEQYGSSVFCNLFLSDEKGLDLHFPHSGHRIPLTRGTVVVFDTGQPHAVIQRGSSGFDVADFQLRKDCSLIFLTWELPVQNAYVASTLQIDFDTASLTEMPMHEEQVWLNGARVSVCPDSGRWLLTG